MTDLLQRAAGRPGPRPDDSPPRPLVVSALALSGVVAAGGLIVASGLALIAWLAGSQGSTADAFRAGVTGWLIGHGSGVTVSGAPVSAVPLGLVLVLAVVFYTLARRLGAASSIAGPRDVLVFAGTAGVSYAVVLALAAWLAGTETVAAGAPRSAAVGFGLAAVFGGLGAAREAGILGSRWAALSQRARAGATGAAYAVAALLAVGLVLTGVMLVSDTATFGRLWSGLDTGVVGGAALVLLCLVLVPNVVLWSVAALLGPGFAIGSGTSVTLTTASLGQVPALPLLAALPGPGTQPAWVVALAAVPVLAGILAGYTACSRAPGETWAESAVLGVASGASAGLAAGLLVAMSGGSVGPGRMGDVGPEVLLCLGAAVLSLGIGGASGALLGHYRVARALDRAD